MNWYTQSLTADPTAQVIITIPEFLSGTSSPTTVSQTVQDASSSILPECGNVSINAAPSIAVDQNVAIVGVQYHTLNQNLVYYKYYYY